MGADRQTGSSNGTSRSARWHFLDWLRAGAMLLVFAFHSGRFFDDLWWHLKSPERALGFTVFTLLLSQWGMPLFFLIAGAAAGLGARHRQVDTKAFIKGRVSRLLVPFVVGVFVVVPPQVYLERLSADEFSGSLFAFYPHYFDGLYFFGGNFSWIGHHLWFLPALFFISVATLPLTRYVTRDSIRRRLVTAVDRYGALVVFGAPVALAHVALRGVGLVDPVAFVLFYGYGALIASDDAFLRAIERSGREAAAIALTTSAAFAVMFFAGLVNVDHLSSYSTVYLALQILAGLSAWAWPHALIAAASRRANQGSAALAWINDSVMPFYILHQTVILTVGFYVLETTLTVWAKAGVIAVASFVITIGLYAVAVRPWSPIRRAFGMRGRAVGWRGAPEAAS